MPRYNRGREEHIANKTSRCFPYEDHGRDRRNSRDHYRRIDHVSRYHDTERKDSSRYKLQRSRYENKRHRNSQERRVLERDTTSHGRYHPRNGNSNNNTRGRANRNSQERRVLERDTTSHGRYHPRNGNSNNNTRGRRVWNSNRRDTRVSSGRYTNDIVDTIRHNQRMRPSINSAQIKFDSQYKLSHGSLVAEKINIVVLKGVRIRDGVAIVCKVLQRGTALEIRGLQAEYELHNRAGENNTGVVKIYDIFIGSDETMLVMEMGEADLWTFLYPADNSPTFSPRLQCSEDDFRFIFLQILNAIKKCHRNGVYHLDIKSENIVVEAKTKKVKLIDFGLSVASENGCVKLKGGTLKCLAPEALTSSTEHGVNTATYFPGKSIDHWGLGVVLYELANGRMPFNDNSLDSGGMCPYEEDCSFDARLLIEQMLCFDPNKRPNVEEILDSNWLKDVEDIRVKDEISHLRNYC